MGELMNGERSALSDQPSAVSENEVKFHLLLKAER
jgi:hypothetical protein